MPISDWLTDAQLLGADFPLPLDQPFTTQTACDAGVSRSLLAALARHGLVRRVLHGVYAASQAPDSVLFRATALQLVIPDCAVVTDRTAAWLHGVPILERGAHLQAPPISVCQTVDSRVRRPDVDGRRRQLLERDVMELHGIRVTTPLRTGLDLGRSLWRFDALAAIDGVLRIGVDHDELLSEIERFRGHRGVRQVRWIAPLGDGRAESPGESALRLHWYDAGLPKPEPQFRILDDWGSELYRLDVPAPEVRYAAEYDGEEFHSSDVDVAHDKERRDWIRRERHWSIDTFRKDDVYGRRTDITRRLRTGFLAAKKSMSVWVP
ncbi:hypothetical protein ACVW00_001872 [Marmoricola sp. URHA0025 HA25]